MSRKSSYSGQIAVVGMDCWYPGAKNLKQLWENVLARRQQFRQTPDRRLPLSDYYDPNPKAPDKTYGSQMAVIDGFEFDWASRRIPKTVIDTADIAHWLALEVAIRAVEHAGYDRNTICCEKTGVVLGNTLTGEFSRSTNLRMRWPYVQRVLMVAAKERGFSQKDAISLAQTMEEYYKSVFSPITEDSLSGNLSNTIAGRICNFFNFDGGGYTVDGACSSSLIAISNAATALANGDLNLALAGGVDISLDTFELIGFAKTGALTSSEMKVYDRRASGFIPGEGSGFVVLKRLEDARADGNSVYAILKGWGISSDGKGGLTAPKASRQAVSLRRAYQRAGYSPLSLDFIEGHGTGTPVGDRVELNGIALAMDHEDESTPRFCGITSLKSIIGHTKAAAGVGAFIKTVMAVNRRVLPPTAGCQRPNDVFENSASCIYPILQGEIRNKTDSLRAGVSAMGFGGINCHVTLESGDPPSSDFEPVIDERSLLVSNQETEIFVFAGRSISSTLQLVQDVTGSADGISLSELTDLAAYLAQELKPQLPVRAAIIAGNPNELLERLKHLENILLDSPPSIGQTIANPQQGLWIGNTVQKNRVGFLFPGQGSQLLNAARFIVERFSWAQTQVRQAVQLCEELESKNINQLIYRSLDKADNQEQVDEWKREISQTEVAQPAICLTSILWLRYLSELNVKPVAVGGHSLGELSAFYAAGTLDEKALLSTAIVRGQAMSASNSSNKSGAMVSLSCSREIAEILLKDVSGYAILANLNSPKQMIVSGEQESIQQVINFAKARGIRTHRLPVSNAFHSQLVSSAAEKLKNCNFVPQELKHISVDLYSSLNGQQISQGHQIREHFAHQITEPVNFINLLQSLEDSCDLFIEVGPGKVLSGLVSDIVDSKQQTCFPVESKPGSNKDLNTVLSNLFVRGCDIRWEVLYEKRLVRPFVPTSELAFIENPLERTFKVSKQGRSQAAPSSKPAPLTNVDTQTQISWKTLSNYLSKRSTFITELIRTDIQTLGLISDAEFSVNGNGQIHSEYSTNEIESSNIISYGSESKQQVHEPALSSGTLTSKKTITTVESFLIDLITQQTGFAPESISSKTRLLDDLNLDSIKAGELIASAARQFDVAGQIDPAPLANAKIEEIAEAIRGFRSDRYIDNQATAQLPTLVRESNDVRGMANKGNESFTQNQRNNQASVAEVKRKALVRDFVVHAREEKISIPSAQTNEKWQYANVLIICEKDDLDKAEILREKFDEKQAQVQIIFYTDARTQSLVANGDFTHFISILPSVSLETSNFKDRITEAVKRLQIFSVVPQVKKADLQKEVVYIQFGGGYFGTQERPSNFEQCSATSFAASIHLERPDLKVRVLDFCLTVDSTTLAKCLFQELSTPEPYSAAGYDEQLTRRVPRPYLQEPADYQSRNISWSSQDVIIVTGGAKGVTAECALALAQETGARLVLLGRSPCPELEGKRTSAETAGTLERFRTLGLDCTYLQCDVSDSNSVHTVIERVQKEIGLITGVVHGAAINIPRIARQVSAEAAFDEISPKLIGVANLIDVLKNQKLKLFAAFSSVIGVTGMKSNAWYAFSNEAMGVILRDYKNQHPQTAVISLAYGVWEEVGMGARMGSVRSLGKMGIAAIPKNEGVRRFMQLVKNDPGDCQVVIVAAMRAMSAQEMGGFDTWIPRLFEIPSASRFLEKIIVNEPGVEVIARAHLSISRDLYLQDHVYNGSYLFPTVFGLEAMAQAVAYATGKTSFSNLRIEDISLERPIVVNSSSGVEIQIHAEVIEREIEDSSKKIYAAIRTAQTGFATEHFSATFVMPKEKKSLKKNLELLESPLNIEPTEDLYGWLLFQGKLFQRLERVYKLNSDEFIFSAQMRELSSTGKDSFADEAKPLLLGDPYFRDTLLQSAQVLIPKNVCLPVKIDCLEIYQLNKNFTGTATGVSIPQVKEGKDYTSTVFAIDDDGNVLERLDGYVAKLLEHRENNPSAEEISEPSSRDESILHRALRSAAQNLDLDTPELCLAYLPGLHLLSKKERHEKELPFLHKIASSITTNPEKIKFTWDDFGKPIIESKEILDLDISLSHDKELCICVIGEGSQGCDIEPIVARSFSDWVALLSNTREPLLKKLIDKQDTLARAGTRIWSTVESLKKAYNLIPSSLEISAWQDDYVLFSGYINDQKVNVLSFPIKLTRGIEKIFTCVVDKR